MGTTLAEVTPAATAETVETTLAVITPEVKMEMIPVRLLAVDTFHQ